MRVESAKATPKWDWDISEDAKQRFFIQCRLRRQINEACDAVDIPADETERVDA